MSRTCVCQFHGLARLGWRPDDVLFQAELCQSAELLLLGFPNTIYNILYRKTEIRLTVASISEGHTRRVHLSNGCEGQMRWPVLNKDHVAS